MKFKYHKIYNVPLEVCTAEQMLAYNLAFSHADLFKKEYNQMPMQFQKSEVVHEAVKFCMRQWEYSRNAKKFDADIIFCCLNAGLENYFKSGCPIFANYEEIGKMFPAYYLN